MRLCAHGCEPERVHPLVYGCVSPCLGKAPDLRCTLLTSHPCPTTPAARSFWFLPFLEKKHAGPLILPSGHGAGHPAPLPSRLLRGVWHGRAQLHGALQAQVCQVRLPLSKPLLSALHGRVQQLDTWGIACNRQGKASNSAAAQDEAHFPCCFPCCSSVESIV